MCPHVLSLSCKLFDGRSSSANEIQNSSLKEVTKHLECRSSSPQRSSWPSSACLRASGTDCSHRTPCLGGQTITFIRSPRQSARRAFPSPHFTSQQGYERDEPVLLDHLVQFLLKVVVCVGFQRVLQQDPASHQQVVQPVGDVEDDSA